MFKGLSKPDFSELFETNTYQKTRGHEYRVIKCRRNLNIRKFFFSDRVTDRWNQLTKEVIASETVNTFKNRLQKFCEIKKGFLKDNPSD